MKIQNTESGVNNKKLAIFVWYRSLRGGGLHENIYDTIIHLRKKFKEIVVVCPVSQYSERFYVAGARVIEVNYDNYLPEDLFDEIGDVDLIHVHPGESRVAGLKYADQKNVPALMTIHGAWFDQLPTYDSKLSYVITVSRYIEEILRKQIPSLRHRICTIENGVDSELFEIRGDAVPEEVLLQPHVLCVSRYDKDKQKMIDFMLTLWRLQHTKNIFIRWVIVGDDPLLSHIKNVATEIFTRQSPIEFVGWKEKNYLPSFYNKAACGYLPGRSAIEAMACGLPVVATGSSGGIKIINNINNIEEAAYSNFGGFGSENFIDDVDQCLEFMKQCCEGKASLSGSVLSQEIQNLFSIDNLSMKLLSLYERAIKN